MPGGEWGAAPIPGLGLSVRMLMLLSVSVAATTVDTVACIASVG